jgi:hypothetical protein
VKLPTSALKDPVYLFNGIQHRRRKHQLSTLIGERLPDSIAYHDLHRSSLALAEVRSTQGVPHVNLVLIDVGPSLLFAGLNTAVLAAARVCTTLDLPLRIVVLSVRPGRRSVDAIDAVVRERLPELRGLRIAYQLDLSDELFSANDVWLATFWATAHALDVACRLGLIEADRVLYLIQDYEPSFFSFSSESALARSTYHAGFTPIVNSLPLAEYLRTDEGVETPSDQIFAPQLDLERLEQAASARRAAPATRILFYGRPSKPRNMFSIGLSALRLAVRDLHADGVEVEVRSAGEKHAPFSLGDGATLQPLGRLSWSGYFAELAATDVVFSLQATVHPSHPPLDGVVSGALSVTNDVGDTRTRLHPRLLAAPADPHALAAAMSQAARKARESPAGAFDPEFLTKLGRDLSTSVVAAVGSLG